MARDSAGPDYPAFPPDDRDEDEPDQYQDEEPEE